MCINCAKILLSKISTKVSLPVKTSFVKCLTPGCNCKLEPAFLCTAYRNNYRIYSSVDGLKIKNNSKSLSFNKNCYDMWVIKKGSGLSSPCDECIYDETYRTIGLNVYLCPNCGFYIKGDSEIGYTENFSTVPIICNHHNEIINGILNKSESILMGSELPIILSEDEMRILEFDGHMINGAFTKDGLERLRNRIQEKIKRDEWIKNVLKDRVEFIIHNGIWRESRPVNKFTFSPPLGTVFIDVNSFISAVQKRENSRLLYECLYQNPCKCRDPLNSSCKLSSNSLIMYLIFKSQLLCKTNQLAISETLSRLYGQKPGGLEGDYYMALWSKFQDSIEIYNWDDCTMQVATILAELFAEIMGKKMADIKDMYHYVFSVQHQVDYIISRDSFLTEEIPTFKKLVAEKSIEDYISYAIELYNSNYPYTMKLYDVEDVKLGFKQMFTSKINSIYAGDALKILRDKNIKH